MSACHHSVNRLLSFIISLSLIFSSSVSTAFAQTDSTLYLPVVSNSTSQPIASNDIGIFRTHISIRATVQWHDLERMQIQILDQGVDWALVLVDDAQLTDLARLRYNPTDTNSLHTLLNASKSVGQWDSGTVVAVRSLLAQADEVALRLAALSAAQVEPASALRAELRLSMQTLSQTTQQAVAAAATVDSDNDGLTDDQESYWCTNPAKADTDLDGVKDGAEVDALKAWLSNETVAPPSSGKPFQGWPNPLLGCFDDDRDSIPDVAEGLELGLNPNRESTDLDKFDDGQELFGFTNCPGGDNNCGYGDLPRSADAGFIGAILTSVNK